jgi:hypothetical protein
MVTRGVAPIHGIMSALGGSRETWAESSQQHEWWVNVQTIDCFPSPVPRGRVHHWRRRKGARVHNLGLPSCGNPRAVTVAVYACRARNKRRRTALHGGVHR